MPMIEVRNTVTGAPMTATIVDGAIGDTEGIPDMIVARAEQLVDEGHVLHPGVETQGVRLSFDDPACAALAFQHAARTSGPTGAPLHGWFGFDEDGALVLEPPASASVGTVPEMEMPPA